MDVIRYHPHNSMHALSPCTQLGERIVCLIIIIIIIIFIIFFQKKYNKRLQLCTSLKPFFVRTYLEVCVKNCNIWWMPTHFAIISKVSFPDHVYSRSKTTFVRKGIRFLSANQGFVKITSFGVASCNNSFIPLRKVSSEMPHWPLSLESRTDSKIVLKVNGADKDSWEHLPLEWDFLKYTVSFLLNITFVHREAKYMYKARQITLVRRKAVLVSVT